jgi:hypothetical protein
VTLSVKSRGAPFRNESKPALVVVLSVVLIHLVALGLPPVNLEWAFIDAAKYFAGGDELLIERYFKVQANTLGTSLLSAGLHRMLPFFPIEYAPRLLSVFGFFLLGVALLRINASLGSKISPAILLACVFTNPLIWTFGGRGTADFLSPCLALFSVSLLWGQSKRFQIVLAVICFGLAIVLKYHAALLLPLTYRGVHSGVQVGLRHHAVQWVKTILAILAIPLVFIIWTHSNFGYWLIHPNFRATHGLDLGMKNLLTNAASYLGYLFLLLLPLSLALVVARLRDIRRLMIAALATLGLSAGGFFLMVGTGEMNFGPLDGKLDPRLINAAFCAGAGCMVAVLVCGASFYKAGRDEHWRAVMVVVAIFFFIGVLAFSRPAQRYLLYLLPLGYCLILPVFEQRRWWPLTAVAGSLLVSVFLGLNQFATGHAALRLTEQLQKLNLISQTDPGIILGHTGNQFPLDAVPKKYVVVAGTRDNQLFAASAGVLPFLSKTYAVIPLQ